MRNKLILIGALVFGLLAAFLVYNYINNVNKKVQERVYTQVVTAAIDIPANTSITDTMVVLKPFPTELLTQQEILGVNDVVGKVTNVSLTKGEVIMKYRVVKPGESTARLAYKLPTGMRAITAPVNEVTGVANLPKIGDRVDVIAVIPPSTASTAPRAGMILQNIQIIALGSSMSEGTLASGESPPVPNTVTLAVDPQTALRLDMAMQGTAFRFILRPAGDMNLTTVVPVTLDQL